MTGLLQGLKPVLVEALIPEGAVKALDVSVLRRATWRDQDVFDAISVLDFLARKVPVNGAPVHPSNAGDSHPERRDEDLNDVP